MIARGWFTQQRIMQPQPPQTPQNVRATERHSTEKAWNGNVHTAPGVNGSHGLLPRPSEIASQGVLQHHGMGQAIPYHTKYLHGVSPHCPLPASPTPGCTRAP